MLAHEQVTGGYADGNLVRFLAKLPLVSPEAKTGWVHLAMEGEWEGHPDGPFRFSREEFEQIVKNFNRDTNPIPFTYEHPNKDSGQPIPAAAWVHDLTVKECADHGLELWAEVEFTDRAASMVSDGEYRFCSVVVDFAATDRKTKDVRGAELFEVGLTNTPFLDGQHPIAFSRKRATRTKVAMSEKIELGDKSPKELVMEVLKELPDDATLSQVDSAVRAKMALDEALSGGGEAPEGEAAMADEPEESVGLMEDGAPMESAYPMIDGLPDETKAALEAKLVEDPGFLDAALADEPAEVDAPAPAMSDAVEAGKARVAALSKQVSDKEATIKTLAARVASLEDAQMERRVDDAIANGEILPADREKLIMLGRRAPDLLGEFLQGGKQSPAVKTSSVYAAGSPDGEHEDKGEDLDPVLIRNTMRGLARAIPDETKRRAAAIKGLRSELARHEARANRVN